MLRRGSPEQSTAVGRWHGKQQWFPGTVCKGDKVGSYLHVKDQFYKQSSVTIKNAKEKRSEGA